MQTCRICNSKLGPAVYDEPAPSVTSTGSLLSTSTQVFICQTCSHAQSPDLPDLRRYYDEEYRISLSSDDHDQLITEANGQSIYRTDKQAQVALDLLKLAPDSSILDFGAAKATTLYKMSQKRPDLQAHVFDVSDAYRKSWHWLPSSQVASHDLPAEWSGRFDAVTAHFVIEHVADPVGAVSRLHNLLKPGGRLFLSVPDPEANPGDLIVVDHINHFTPASLCLTIERAGFRNIRLDRDSLPATLIIVAEPGAEAHPPQIPQAADLAAYCAQWKKARAAITSACKELGNERVAIYGAGFYGTWLYSLAHMTTKLECFLDNNVHLIGQEHFGLPILSPGKSPEGLHTILVGLNPRHARRIIGQEAISRIPDIRFVYIPD